MNCKNCEQEIYFNGDNLTWYHIGVRYRYWLCKNYKIGSIIFAEPKIDKAKETEIKTKSFKKMLKVFGKYDIYETEDGLNITGYSHSPNTMVDISKDIIQVNGLQYTCQKKKGSGGPYTMCVEDFYKTEFTPSKAVHCISCRYNYDTQGTRCGTEFVPYYKDNICQDYKKINPKCSICNHSSTGAMFIIGDGEVAYACREHEGLFSRL